MTQFQELNIFKKLLTYSSVGLITDMDGTLSHIVDRPGAAKVTSRNLELLQELQQHLKTVAVLSGRAVQDLADIVGLSTLTYVGNHGMEYLDDGQVIVLPEISAYRPNLESAINLLQPHLLDGMWIEDKQTTLSIHYRNVKNPADVAIAFTPTVERIAQANQLQAFSGRKIFEIRPAVNINKGVAFEQLIKTHNLTAALYLGDDTTDVDAFIMAKHLRETNQCYSFAIGVESNDMPSTVGENADILVEGVSGVEDFLSSLLSAVKASST